MKIKVLLFGQLAEAVAPEMEISDVKDTDQLVQEINKRFPVLSDMHYRIAVDKNLVTKNTILSNESAVALLPAFSGG